MEQESNLTNKKPMTVGDIQMYLNDRSLVIKQSVIVSTLMETLHLGLDEATHEEMTELVDFFRLVADKANACCRVMGQWSAAHKEIEERF